VKEENVSMTVYDELKKKIWLYVDDIFHFRLTTRVVNVFFSLMIVTLPLVNKISKATAIFYLILFFRMIYNEKDFVMPYIHKLFLFGLFAIIVMGDFLNGISLESIKRALYLAIFISLYYATIYFIRKKILKFDTLVYTIVISMTIYMINGYIQFISGYDFILHVAPQSGGICSVSRNRNIFGLAMLFYIAVLSFLALEKKNYYAILLLPALLAMVLTLSRQIWLATALFLFIVILYKHRMISFKFWAIGLITAVIVGFIVLQIPEACERLTQLEHGYSSGRIELWKLLLSSVQEAPMFGHGFQSPLNTSRTIIEYNYAHNLTVGILFNLGVFGFIFYIIFIGYFLRLLTGCKNMQAKPYLLALFLALFLVQQQLGGSMLVHKFIGPSIMIFLALVTSYCSAETFLNKKEKV